MTIGEFLKQKREEKNLSLRQLAYKANMSHTNIADLERGNIKKEESIFRIIAALNLSAKEQDEAITLMTKENTPKNLIEGVTDIRKKWIYSFIGNIEQNYGSINNMQNNYTQQDKDLLSDLTKEEKEDVKKYIEFLKLKRGGQ